MKLDGKYAEFSVDINALDAVMKYITKFEIRNLICTPPTLEELFMRHYEHDWTEGRDRR